MATQGNMVSKSSIYIRWTITFVMLIGSSHDLIGFRIGGTLGCVYANEILSRNGDGDTIAPHYEVSISTPDRHTVDSENAPILLGGHLGFEDSRFVPAGCEQVWNEEFNGAELDLEKWDYRSEGRCSDGSGCSVLSRNCISLNGSGQLALSTNEVDGLLQTGMISTTGKFEPLYGYFESRIRFQRQEGHHGAFWLKSTTYGKFPGDPLRAGSEVDIAEFFGVGRSDGGIGINVYWNGKEGETVRSAKKADLKPVLALESEELCDQFHIYSLIWTPTQYEFLIDGHKIFATSDGMSHRGQPLILSLLAHKWEADKLDRTKLDDSMLVDYVRVYQIPPKRLSNIEQSSR